MNIIKTVNVFGKNKHLPYFAHKLNLVSTKLLDNYECKFNIHRVKSIVTYFKKSVNAVDDLRKSVDN